ncbi:hypothetical protein OSB04_012329 [Centaurea solstitialis]|uniref:Uncharacterized protein n=1 Tax=Centaurea solstitialis TaxID=347529 RepID=A0AA38TB61_9ASTR|nr:hypothetical protein OSB04_012329 [Centaurea solstitialis]
MDMTTSINVMVVAIAKHLLIDVNLAKCLAMMFDARLPRMHACRVLDMNCAMKLLHSIAHRYRKVHEILLTYPLVDRRPSWKFLL